MLYLSPETKMIKAILAFLALWAAIVILLASISHWSFMWYQIYSVYLERSNYIHEVDMWLVDYDKELDKSLGIEIDTLCIAWGRTASQCFLQMLYDAGQEYRPFRWF